MGMMDQRSAQVVIDAVDAAIEQAKAASARVGDPKAMWRVMRIEMSYADSRAFWEALEQAGPQPDKDVRPFDPEALESRYRGVTVEVWEQIDQPAVIAGYGHRVRFPIAMPVLV